MGGRIGPGLLLADRRSRNPCQDSADWPDRCDGDDRPLEEGRPVEVERPLVPVAALSATASRYAFLAPKPSPETALDVDADFFLDRLLPSEPSS